MENSNRKIEYYTPQEQMANIVTHGAGILLSIAAFVFLMLKANDTGNDWKVAAILIFGISLIALYTSSTLYHSIPGENAKFILRKIDHSAIYLLIAGTYTPFLLIPLRGPWGWSLFVIIWAIAVGGILYKIFKKIGPRWISALMYVAMGWIVIFAARKLFIVLPVNSFYFLIAGGLIYTSGTLFYVWKKLPYNHAIWHLFVLSGSICHIFAVYYLV